MCLLCLAKDSKRAGDTPKCPPWSGDPVLFVCLFVRAVFFGRHWLWSVASKVSVTPPPAPNRGTFVVTSAAPQASPGGGTHAPSGFSVSLSVKM